MLKGELNATLHTCAALTAGEIPVVVTLGVVNVAFYLIAKGTYSVVFAIGGAGCVDFLLNVPVVHFGVVYLYLLNCVTALVSAMHLLETVGFDGTVCYGNDLFFTPEGVSIGIDLGIYGHDLEAKSTLINLNTGSYTVSRNHERVPANDHFIVVLAGSNVFGINLAALANAVYEIVLVGRNVIRIGFTALTNTVYEIVLVRRNVVRIGLAALTNTVNEGVGMRGDVVGILCATGALAISKAVANGISFGSTALTGGGSGTGCLTKCVDVLVLSTGKHVENVFKAGDLLDLLAGGKAGEEYSQGQHYKCQLLKALHFRNPFKNCYCACTRLLIIALLEYYVNRQLS